MGPLRDLKRVQGIDRGSRRETKVCVWRVAGSGGGGGLGVQDGGRGGEQRENMECDCCD